MRRELLIAVIASAVAVPSVVGQTPQPFPRPAAPQPVAPPAAPTAPAPNVVVSQAPGAVDPTAPTEATLGFPLHPTAQFVASYDAGRGQRYYLFGATAPFADLVAFYRTQLKERGDRVFEQPATHMFQVGRFRDETMAFPPGVTVKDFTWGGSAWYPNPAAAQPERFPTMIMIVPQLPGAER